MLRKEARPPLSNKLIWILLLLLLLQGGTKTTSQFIFYTL